MNEEYPHCPICGRECCWIYKDRETGEILGCEECIDTKDAWEVGACFPDEK